MLAASLEDWGAEGIYAPLADERLKPLLAAAKHPIPIVNNSVSAKYSGVVHVIGEAQEFAGTGVEHLRHLGIKNFGMLLTEAPPGPSGPLISSFKKLTEPFGSVLLLPVAEDQLLGSKSSPQPVPAALATWLRELPKPCGVLCPCDASGKFLVECCAKLGLQVPREIAVIGCDDADLCLSCTPTVTSIMPNMELMGSESVRILLSILDGVPPPTPTIRIKGVNLVARESAGHHPRMLCDVAGALEYIEANATKGLTVTELMHVTQRSSHPTFYEAFQKATGKTPAEAIRDRQLEEVRRLLATTELPVAAVSGITGFSSSTVMGRLFLQVEGMTPMEYRKKNKE
jgi:LacI family transcriptional regulator